MKLTQNRKRKFIIITVLALLILSICYEISYRWCVHELGEINTDHSPPTIFYSSFFWGGILDTFFASREALPLGKVKLKSGKFAFEAGKVYMKSKKNPSQWKDITYAINALPKENN